MVYSVCVGEIREHGVLNITPGPAVDVLQCLAGNTAGMPPTCHPDMTLSLVLGGQAKYCDIQALRRLVPSLVMCRLVFVDSAACGALNSSE